MKEVGARSLDFLGIPGTLRCNGILEASIWGCNNGLELWARPIYQEICSKWSVLSCCGCGLLGLNVRASISIHTEKKRIQYSNSPS